VETAARAWLRLTDQELRERSNVNASRPDHGSRDLRFLRLVVPSRDHQTRRRADPIAVLLYYREDARRPNVSCQSVALRDEKRTDNKPLNPKAKRTKPARSRTGTSCVSQLATCAPEDDLSPGASGLQRWFGAGGAGGAPFAVVEPLSPRVSGLGSFGDFVSGTFADVDEATAAKAAVAVAFAAAGVPSHWPVFAPVLGPARRAFVGRTGDAFFDKTNVFAVGSNASGAAPTGGWSVRYETDSLEGVAAERAHARTVHGLCDVLRAQLAALHGVQTADALVAEAKITARLAFVLTRGRRRRRIESVDAPSRSAPPLDASGSSGESSGESSSDGERGDVRAGEAFLAVAGGAAPPRRRRRGKRAERKEGADENLDEEEKEDEPLRREPKDRRVFRKEHEKEPRFSRWDDLAPWAPWATVPDPWRRVEVHATYREVSLESLRADESANANALSLEAAPEWTVRAVPRGAAEAAKETFFGHDSFPDFSGPETDGTRAFGASSDNDASWVRAHDQAHGDPGTRGLAELYYLLSRSAGTRGARGAETMGRLASAEFWDDETETGVSPPPRAPPESVVQDVLRDIFESGISSKEEVTHSERTFVNAKSEIRKEEEEGAKKENGDRKEKNENENENAESLFPNPARSAPPDSLLARLALHALVFGNARAVATLWRRFVREIRFAHWDRGVPLPRTGGVGFEAERRRRAAAREAGESLDEENVDANENENESLDEDERVFRDEQVDTRACVAHQKIQLINACIRRRKAVSVDAYERSDAARERRDREADATAATTTRGTRHPTTTRRVNTPRAKSPDDDVDLVALLGAAGPTTVGPATTGPVTAGPATAATRVSADENGVFGVFGRAVSEADGFETASDGGDDEGLAADEPDDPVTGGPIRAPEGVKHTHPSGLRLLAPPHRRMRVPETQPPPVFTEDAAREREAAMHALGDTPEGRAARARLQSDQLVSDMSAFKAANPGACLADFVRWHSPRDWVEEETDQISDGMCYVEADAADSTESASAQRRDRFAPKPGRLSARMGGGGGRDNLWKTLWRDAPIVPASRQKPLFDPIREGERALEYLDAAPPPEIFAQILAAAAAAVGNTYASFSVTTRKTSSSASSAGEENTPNVPNVHRVDAPSREALRRAHAMASRVLRRACPYETEYAAVAGELQRAERAVARSAALARRMPGVDAGVREALLLAAADDEARADAEVAETERSVEANGCSGDAGDAGDSGSHPEASAAPRPPPRVVEALLPRTHPERRRGSALAGLIPREKNTHGAESAAHAEYVVRAGGGHAQTHRAHAVTAPCFIRVSSAVAYQY
jgi:Rab3 GTPase-activating protein catalytic subunit